MNKQVLYFLQTVLISLDIIILNLIIFLASIIFDRRISDEYTSHYIEYWILINIVWLLSAWLVGIYSQKNIISFEPFFRKTTKAYLIWITLLFLYLFFTREIVVSRLFISATIIGFRIGLFINRFLYISIKKRFVNNNQGSKNILIIGYNNTSKKLASYLEQESLNTEIVGYIENNEKVTELSNYPIMGDLESTVEFAKKHYVEEIFSTITPEQDPRLYEVMQQVEYECIRFKIVPDFSMFVKGPIHVSYYNDIPIVTLRGESLETFNNKLKKRAFDVFVSTLVIIFILSWLIPLVSLCILLESRGPIFFMQWRTGKNKKNFRCLKFRSMHVNKDSDVVQATKTDNRITKVGKFLRKTSLDEFPQFINVFLGDMSVVGPRPHMIHHTNEYSKIVNQYMVRLFSKPGITGWAQINGFRGEIAEPKQIKKRVEYDLWYMENWSLLLDIKIVFLTMLNVLKGEKNAY